ncbi:hypothetical protein BDW62DRAFT_214401 [Aspergillus aurantiobrunneus]
MDDLVFVNASNPTRFRDEDVRRTVRRRVMRDIGKARRRKTNHPPALIFAWQPLESPVPCLNSYPPGVDSDPRARELIQFMHVDAEYNYRPFRKIWFSMGLSDRTAFILCKANAAMFLEQVRLCDQFRYEHCRETLTYYGQCVRQVMERLSDPVDCVSKGVLTAVLGLICHDLHVGTLDRWAYHIRGLAQIVSIRGGISDLDANLQLFVCWFDVLGSAARDSPPRMPPCSVHLDDLAKYAKKGTKTSRTMLSNLLDEIRKTPVDIDMSCLVETLERMAALSDFVNESSCEPGFWKTEDDMRPLRILGPVTHALLSIPRADCFSLNSFAVVREMARLALLIILAGLKASYGFSAIEMAGLQEKLATFFSGAVRNQLVLPFLALQLWSLLSATLLQPNGAARSLYVHEISLRMASMRVPDGASAVAAARDVIWIEDIASEDAVASLIIDIDKVHLGDHRCSVLPEPPSQ